MKSWKLHISPAREFSYHARRVGGDAALSRNDDIMSRPHVEFVQAQSLPWRPATFAHLGADVEVKVLSRDAETGATTAILRIPTGWRQAGAFALSADEEFFVLDGALELDGQRYGLHCYGYLPAGYERGAASSATGADILTFFSAEPSLCVRVRSASADVIPFLDAFEMPWHTDKMDPAYGESGLCWKILRRDETARDVTMLVASRPHFHPPDWRGPQERHDCVEEMFLLSGDYIGDRGLMEAGAYFWRPPGLDHGPYGSRGGNLGLFRTLGADLANNWTDDRREIDRDAARHEPIIADMATRAKVLPWKSPPRY